MSNCLNRFTRCLLLALLSTLTLPVSAVAPALSSHLTQIEVSELQNNDYSLTLGAVKKIDGEWTTNRERKLSGVLRRQTFEINRSVSAKDIYDQYRTQWLNRGAAELFRCEGLDCGSSNSWANDRFGIRQLYGLDQHQWYSAFVLADAEGGESYVAMYVVTRGNRRSYLQIDQIQTEIQPQKRAEDVLSVLKTGRSYRIPGVMWRDGKVAIDSTLLQPALEALQSDPDVAIYAVGHDSGPGGFEQQQQRSMALARALKAWLSEQGLSDERVEVHGLGGLAPGAIPALNGRVELVIKP